jgi:dipeptidyl aminopeptidase/acylaminoacyl peptidase
VNARLYQKVLEALLCMYKQRFFGKARIWVTGLLVCCMHIASARDRNPITIDDLVGRVQIPVISLSPDGAHVAYLTVEGMPRLNSYEIDLWLISTTDKSSSVLLDRYELPGEKTFDADSGALQQTAGQFAWKSDSSELAYTTHCHSGMVLKKRRIIDGREATLLSGFAEIEIVSEGTWLNAVTLSTARRSNTRQSARGFPVDFGLRIKDGYRFYGPFLSPQLHAKWRTQRWNYDWKNLKRNGSAVISYRGFPDEWQETKSKSQLTRHPNSVVYTRDETPSPDGSSAAMIEDSIVNLRDPDTARRKSRIILKDLRTPQATPRILVDSEDPPSSRSILGWRDNGQELFYLNESAQDSSIVALHWDGRSRIVYKELAGLSAPSPSSELSRNGRIMVLIRTTNTSPDELLKVDFKTGLTSVLARPNAKFESRDAVTVRFIRIACCGGEFHGRLYLPKHLAPGKKYPLVFTNYISTAGFYASVGDEVPILVLVQHGIAVFALHSSPANIISRDGDFRFEIERVSKPLHAMEWVRDQLATEGIIDPERCGLTGVSYGAEIAMYAYWNSKIFRALSVATASWEPMNYYLAGLNYSQFLDSRGLTSPDSDSFGNWKQLSASLNLRTDLPPLLLQSSDKEEYFGNIETWFSIRRHGLASEWLLYPNEGHVKREPANKWWVYDRNLDWFRFWLQDEEDTDPAKVEQYARWKEMRTHHSIRDRAN